MDFNNPLRTKAKNDFEKDFFKLMNNSVFGKLCRTFETMLISNYAEMKTKWKN